MHPALSKSLFNDEVGRWPSDLAGSRGWIIHQAEYPVIDCEFTRLGRTPLRLYCEFDNWDEQPPAISLKTSEGVDLTSLLPNPTSVFNANPHEKTRRPFICMAGSREFHTHSSHVNETWDQYRGKSGFGMGHLLDKIWNAWLKGTG